MRQRGGEEGRAVSVYRSRIECTAAALSRSTLETPAHMRSTRTGGVRGASCAQVRHALISARAAIAALSSTRSTRHPVPWRQRHGRRTDTPTTFVTMRAPPPRSAETLGPRRRAHTGRGGARPPQHANAEAARRSRSQQSSPSITTKARTRPGHRKPGTLTVIVMSARRHRLLL